MEKLAGHIVSCHLKDLALDPDVVSVHIDEVPIGVGEVDVESFVHAIQRLDRDVPALLEHLNSAQEYADAAKIVRSFMSERQ